jgi:hypothetical protein
MTLPAGLLRMAPWAHALLTEVLQPGGLAVDLTAGNGRDTDFLFRLVGEHGRVLAFDVQEEALQETAGLLEQQGAKIRSGNLKAGEPYAEPGIYLVHDCHSRLSSYLSEPVPAIIATLGCLPDGDTAFATASPSTLSALRAALEFLLPGGRLAVICYVDPSGRATEAEKVEQLFAGLPPEYWDVLELSVPNRQAAPTLLVIERRPR